MTFFADEGVDVPFVKALRREEYPVLHALELMRGASDGTILREANERKCILLTKDKDFGEMILKDGSQCEGIVLIRIDDLSYVPNTEWVISQLLRHTDELQGSFTVIQEDKVRIRKLNAQD